MIPLSVTSSDLTRLAKMSAAVSVLAAFFAYSDPLEHSVWPHDHLVR